MAGTLDLMLTYVEQGTSFTLDYGDIDEAFYGSLESVLSEAVELLKKQETSDLYLRFRKRFLSLKRRASPIGWGYGDDVDELVSELEHFWGELS